MVLMMVFSIFSAGVSAAWDQYQGNPSHNGQITGTAPTSFSSGFPKHTQLPTNGNVWAGVDTPPLMETVNNVTYAYVLYNGGNYDTATGDGGARLAKIRCSDDSIVWNVVLSTTGGFQLSTPYLDVANRCIYAAASRTVYKVTSIDAVSPTVNGIFTVSNSKEQINTPITRYGSYIYFGSWVGNGTIDGANKPGKYYQMKISDGSFTTKHIYSQAKGFYWAGAIDVTVNGTTYIVFGGDNGYLYYVNASNGFGNSPDTNPTVAPKYDLSSLGGVTAGNVRSSISTDGTYLYFTSQGPSNASYIWRVKASKIANLTANDVDVIQLSGNSSTSTPAISANGKIYVGYYNGFSTGGIDIIDLSTFTMSNPTSGTITPGPVQSSVIVYSTTYFDDELEEDVDIDYLYFTTNITGGRGYCYSYVPSTGVAGYVWDTGSGGNYTLQGMAAENGYLSFGNDANKFYVIH